jgi:hypothetical protein
MDVATAAAVIHAFRRDTRTGRQVAGQGANTGSSWRTAGWRARGG